MEKEKVKRSGIHMDITYGCRWEGKHIRTCGYLVGGQHMGHTLPTISFSQSCKGPKGGEGRGEERRNCVFKQDVTFLNLKENDLGKCT